MERRSTHPTRFLSLWGTTTAALWFLLQQERALKINAFVIGATTVAILNLTFSAKLLVQLPGYGHSVCQIINNQEQQEEDEVELLSAAKVSTRPGGSFTKCSFLLVLVYSS